MNERLIIKGRKEIKILCEGVRIKIKGNIFLSNSHDTIFAKLSYGEIYMYRVCEG